MPLSASVVMTLQSFETIPAPIYPPPTGQETGISVVMTFICASPGPGMPSTYNVTLTSAQITTINNAGSAAQKQAALQTVVIDQLQKQYRPAAIIAAVLNSFVGLNVTV